MGANWAVGSLFSYCGFCRNVAQQLNCNPFRGLVVPFLSPFSLWFQPWAVKWRHSDGGCAKRLGHMMALDGAPQGAWRWCSWLRQSTGGSACALCVSQRAISCGRWTLGPSCCSCVIVCLFKTIVIPSSFLSNTAEEFSVTLLFSLLLCNTTTI